MGRLTLPEDGVRHGLSPEPGLDEAPPADAQAGAATVLEASAPTPLQVRHVGLEARLASLGQYRLLEELGRGGMGRVYKALHTVMGRVVAVKVIAPELAQNPLAVEWFRREVRAATRLQHPNVVMAYDANEADGLLFLVMEFVDGTNLDALVAQQGPLPVHLACEWMRQAASALQYAHEQGLVHRDIKPANLLIPLVGPEAEDTPRLKVVDFGLARLQHPSKGETIALQNETGLMGTPDFISPEQSRDIHSADIRSDLYSLGCTFYYALAGRVPFPGDTAWSKLTQHLAEEAAPLCQLRPEVPAAVSAVVRRLMAKDPRQRYQTPAELMRDLEPWCKAPAEPAPAGATSVPQAPAAPTVAAPSGPLSESLLEPVWQLGTAAAPMPDPRRPSPAAQPAPPAASAPAPAGAGFLDRCRSRWPALALLLGCSAGLALWCWLFGRLSLSSAGPSFRWNSLRSAWVFLEMHPSILLGLVLLGGSLSSAWWVVRRPRA